MYEPVASLDDLWSGEMLAVEVQGRRICLVNIDGVVRAFADRCVHKGVPLSHGTLEESVLTCFGHGWQFDMRSGCGLNPRDTRLSRLAVRVDGDVISVDIEQQSTTEEVGEHGR